MAKVVGGGGREFTVRTESGDWVTVSGAVTVSGNIISMTGQLEVHVMSGSITLESGIWFASGIGVLASVTIGSGLYTASGIGAIINSGVGVTVQSGMGVTAQSGVIVASGLFTASGVGVIINSGVGVTAQSGVIVASGLYHASGVGVIINSGVGVIQASGNWVSTTTSGQPQSFTSGAFNSAGITAGPWSGLILTSGIFFASGVGVTVGTTALSGLILTSGVWFASGIGVLAKISGNWVEAHITSGAGVSIIQSSGLSAIQSGLIGVTSAEVHITSGIVTIVQTSGISAIQSGEIHVMSGILNVQVLSGLLAVTSGQVHILSGEVTIAVPVAFSGGVFTATAASGGAILTSCACDRILLKALAVNSGDLHLGGAPLQSGQGYILEPGERITVDIDNAGRINIVASVSGDVLTYYTVNG